MKGLSTASGDSGQWPLSSMEEARVVGYVFSLCTSDGRFSGSGCGSLECQEALLAGA